MRRLPSLLVNAIEVGDWSNRDPDRVRGLIGGEAGTHMELYPDIAQMEDVTERLDEVGYVDRVAFCFVRKGVAEPQDPRLVFENSLIIAGATTPGDDVFLSIDLESDEFELFLFDWDFEVPHRWVPFMKLEEFLRALKE